MVTADSADLSIPKLAKTLVFSAIDHACHDGKVPYTFVKSTFEQWKHAKQQQQADDQAANESYIIQYESKRLEFENAYQQWFQARKELLEEMKHTQVIGEQQRLITELSKIPFPEVLHHPIPDIYTKHKVT